MGFSSDFQGYVPIFHYGRLQEAGQTVDWVAFENHIQENPEEARTACPVGEMVQPLFPLEAALNFEVSPPPLSTVQLLLQLCPEAATIKDSCALHSACSLTEAEEGPEIVGMVLNANPAMAAKDGAKNVLGDCMKIGREQRGLPLHLVVNYLPSCVRIVPDLIQACQGALRASSSVWDLNPIKLAVSQTNYGIAETDLIKLLLEYGHRNGTHFGKLSYDPYSALNRLITTADVCRLNFVDDLEQSFQNVCLGIKAAGACRAKMSVESMWDYPLLQASIAYGWKQWIFDRIWEQQTSRMDLFRKDPLGQTPLDVAIDMVPRRKNFNRRGDEIDFGAVIKRLLDDDSNGASEVASHPLDDNGTLPLHRALHLAVNFEKGSNHIANAFPGALSIPDPETKLIPCLLAAVGEQSKVGTIFGLMIMSPDLVANLCGQKMATA